MLNPPTAKKGANSTTKAHKANRVSPKATGKRKGVADENINNGPSKHQNTTTDRQSRHGAPTLTASSNRAEEWQPSGQPDDDDDDMLQKCNELMG